MHKSLNTSIENFNNVKLEMVGTELGKQYGLTESSKWVDILECMRDVNPQQGPVDITSGYASNNNSLVEVRIPSGYYLSTTAIYVRRSIAGRAMYNCLYRRYTGDITSSSSAGDWPGSASSLKYITVNSLPANHILFGAIWNDGSEHWQMSGHGMCWKYNYSWNIAQTEYKYYKKNWAEDQTFWLPCTNGGRVYNVTVWYMLVG